MTIDELGALIKRAEEVTGCRINFSRDSAGHWSVYSSGMPDTRDRYGVELGDCVALLKEWATPPKPETLTFTLDTAYCERVLSTVKAIGTYDLCDDGDFIVKVAEALKPYQIPE